MTEKPERKPLLRVEGLRLHYRGERGIVRAVDDVGFEVARNQALVVLGESGCGKSSLVRALFRVLPRNVETCTGKVWFDGDDVMAWREEEFRRRIRGVRMALVMQAAMNALNPVVRVGEQVAEPLRLHLGWGRERARERAAEVFRLVGIPADFLRRYPFELSGGMRQRAVLAMALVTEPDLVVLDEPTSALDVLTQANIMNLLKRIKAKTKTSFILITHDIATSSEVADRVALMYAGQIVELNSADKFFRQPSHPYAKALLASVPRLRDGVRPESIPGRPPNLIEEVAGCRFAARCPVRFEMCGRMPEMSAVAGDGQVRCWLYDA